MRARSFKVNFSRVVGDDAHEIDYGPDYMEVRPIFGAPAGVAQEWIHRIEEVGKAAREADPKAEDLASQLILDILREFVDGWHLEGPAGPIPKPATDAELDALPLALRAGLLTFLVSFRGDAPNPTTSG